MNNSKPFLLGFFSVAGQVLLLRELVATFNGDELFIGWALFGWLLSVAVGAALAGGVKRPGRTDRWFTVGAIVLVAMIPAIRFAPMVVSDVALQVIPFGPAALLSTLLMLPVGLISGWLFCAITREGWHTQDSIVVVYLWEGVGAFAGGLILSLMMSVVPSNATLAALVAVTTIAFTVFARKERSTIVALGFIAVTIVVLMGTGMAAIALSHTMDSFKYRPYTVEASFDTQYSRQVILSRDSLTILVTDNKVEATFPNRRGAESLILPPLLHRPRATSLLYFGRGEFGLAELSRFLPELEVTSVDPRRSLDAACDYLLGTVSGITRVTDDPLSFIHERSGHDRFDVIVVDAGEPDNYRADRLLTSEFFLQSRRLISEDGLLVVPTVYDTDRYVTVEVAALLGTIYNSLLTAFDHVIVWPGAQTLFVASPSDLEELNVDEVGARLDSLAYEPAFLDESLIRDRLSEFKKERLLASLAQIDGINSVMRPVLPHLQGLYRSGDGLEKFILSDRFVSPYGVMVGMIPLAAIFAWVTFGRARRRRFGLFLYSTAGLVSIALELLSFYVYQTTVGSLYTEIAALVGAFMLGLAGGTYYSRKLSGKRLEYPALVVLMVATVAFLLTWQRVEVAVALGYHLMFLFVVAQASGSLFVAATVRYYEDRPLANRGVGYAVELVGSAIGALLTLTLLLPAVGITWVLVILGAILMVAFIGAACTERCY